MKTPDWRILEETAFACWPAREQVERDGWVLRASEGFTKRANSANALSTPANPAAIIADCRQFFAERALRPVFRLISVVENTAVDAALADLGFARVEPSLVLVKPLARRDAGADIAAISLDEWMDAYRAVSDNAADPAHAKHRILLDRLPAERCLHVLRTEGRPVACGLGVIHRGIVSLLDIRVRPDQRRQGLGRMLVNDIVAWAAGRGADWAMLQVVEDNQPARQLYARAGFAPAYGYFYRT